MDSRAAEPIQTLSVNVGERVMLPCPCAEDTKQFAWQIGEEMVVNHCCVDKYPLNKTYGKRTQVFLLNTKGNCSLLLHDVSLNDQKTFTCHVFEGEHTGNTYIKESHNVVLKVEDITKENDQSPQNGQYTQDPSTGFAVGVPLSLILVILTVVIVALLIRKRQRRSKMGVIYSPQAMAEMNHTPV
ncbi:hypothetical protein QTP86_026803 [Hemibagrus guttatus]|nr:hypothetical protein QTP86_026803 [Hemibagrus guttatus]